MLNTNLGYDPYSEDENGKRPGPTLAEHIAVAYRMATLKALREALINLALNAAHLAVRLIPGVIWIGFTRIVLGIDPMSIFDPYRLQHIYGPKLPSALHWLFPLIFGLVAMLDMCILGLMVLLQQYIIWFLFQRKVPNPKRDGRGPEGRRPSNPRRPRGPMRF